MNKTKPLFFFSTSIFIQQIVKKIIQVTFLKIVVYVHWNIETLFQGKNAIRGI